ncbi:ABC transporter [Annulohypoxylon maeteangense]|uniref:ABC transporter n=1 Tax=Annulohypoxylon maeteangense TaxID=1927788 RepID=UPI002007BB30|nr:ABC transporter [Annulohypoxylon maeteangense]KAI0889038.1 ABC transporter [Annulohypoxylon maeteangense]
MHQFGFRDYGWDSVPLRSQSLYTLNSTYGKTSISSLQWIHDLSDFTRAGYLQLTIIIASFLVIVRYLLHRPYSKVSGPESNVHAVSWIFELSSQLLRASSLAFMIVAAVKGEGRWTDATALAYAFVIGVLRLAYDLEWRHIALHHTNFILAGSLLILTLGELLPYIDTDHDGSMSAMMICSMSTLAAAVFVAFATRREWIPPSLDLDISEKIPTREPSPEETCSWLEYYVTYEWLTPLMLQGLRRQMTLEELPNLPWYDEPFVLLSRIQEARRKGQSTFWTLVYFLHREVITMGCWIALSFIFEMIAPYAMYELLRYLSDPEGSQFRPWVWLALLFIGPLSRSVCFQQYVFKSTRLLVRVRAALTQELYYKALGSMELDDEIFAEIAATDKEKEKSKQTTTSTGRLANLMGADVDTIARGRDVVLVAFGVTSGSIVALIGLYKLLDWTALVGIVTMLVLSPFPVLIARRMAGIQRDMKRIQDSRISVISEYLASIRAIKYFSWEEAIIKRVNEIRLGEQKKIWALNMTYITLNQLTEAIPNLSLVLIFTLQVLVRKEPLTAEVAFTAITLIRTLRRNLSMASNMSRGFTAAGVSIKRLDRYLNSTTPLQSHPVGPLQISKATFRRHKKASFGLENISIDFVEGGLNVITGQSGSGKTTLLMSILGETLLENGTITCPEDIAYASQSPWLQNETIRDNILFNSPFEQARYDRVINACGLPIDFDEFPERDGTEVGENGASLSGGQKSRVALARTLYSKASVILLDDVFSALDSKTSAFLWEEAFCGDLLKGRTVVLVTQLPWIAPQADLTVTLENGSVKDIQQNLGVVRKSVTLNKTLVDEGNLDETVEAAATHTAESNDTTLNGSSNVSSNGDFKSAEDKRRDEVTQEALKTGPTARLQFFQYMRLFGNPFYAMLALSMSILSTTSFVGTGLWIAVWVDAYGKDDAYNIGFYLGIYAAWSIADVLFSGLTYIAYENGGWYAARTLHTTFIKAVLSVPLSWYKATPIGRVVNRFSRDMDSIDNQVAGMLRMGVETLTRLSLQIVAVGSVLPVFMLPAAACCAVGIVAGELYTRTAVAVKRLVSSSQSPLFAHFADTLAGLPIIRARANMAQTFGEQLADKLRIFERSSEAQFNCNRWVALKVDMMTTLVTVAAGAIAVSKAGLIAAGVVGFSLSNATTLSQLIIMLVRASNELEIEMQSFHRVREYASVEPEEKPEEVKKITEYSDNPESAVPHNWPTTGEVEFRNVTIKYDLDGPEILKDINLKFSAGERVAVVGRTGSGKSTLVLSLLRFTNVVSGQILFDGVDITMLPRRKLREALTIIPQEAVLFNGDVRSNLDPTGEIPTETLEKALQYCSGIASFQYHQNAERAQNGDGLLIGDNDTYSDESPSDVGITLSTPVKPKGENFSHGQRQVLSLCRALVRGSKLMLLDEATASMDYETDQGIQEVLRKELNEYGRDRTLVTIAHRLKTIIDYDRVVVMSAGSVLEVGSPKELYETKGQFYDMMKHSGEFEDLERFLNDKA